MVKNLSMPLGSVIETHEHAESVRAQPFGHHDELL